MRTNRYGRWLGWAMVLMLAACTGAGTKKLNRRLTFWRKDKIPYGTYVAYENMQYLFPYAEMSVNKESPEKMYAGEDVKKAYVIISQWMDPNPEEIEAVMRLAYRGHTVFMSSLYFGDSLMRKLHMKPSSREGTFPYRDTLQVSVAQPETGDRMSFMYPGSAFDNYFERLDSSYTEVLGWDEKKRPNLVRIGYKGGGAVMVQLAPMAFTNFFLLHKQNKAYFDNVFSYIPRSVKEVVWDDYFRYRSNRDGFSAFRFIFKDGPFSGGLAWATWLLLLLLLLILLFQSKRLQRIVPVIEPLRNNSLDFVKTIGRLYYQRKDNQNLVVKMVTHFQDHVRTRYNIVVDLTDEGFADRLAHRTGVDRVFLAELTGEMRKLQESGSVSDEELLDLNHKLEAFYKQA